MQDDLSQLSVCVWFPCVKALSYWLSKPQYLQRNLTHTWENNKALSDPDRQSGEQIGVDGYVLDIDKFNMNDVGDY